MKKLTLIIEKSHQGLLWGRTNYKNNLLVEKASSVLALERKMKKLLSDFYDLHKEKIEFEIAYDLSVFFEQKDFLNISGIAKMANINASLLRQYAAGIKFPSAEKAAEIEGVIRRIGNELSGVKISARLREGEKNRNNLAKVCPCYGCKLLQSFIQNFLLFHVHLFIMFMIHEQLNILNIFLKSKNLVVFFQ